MASMKKMENSHRRLNVSSGPQHVCAHIHRIIFTHRFTDTYVNRYTYTIHTVDAQKKKKV